MRILVIDSAGHLGDDYLAGQKKWPEIVLTGVSNPFPGRNDKDGMYRLTDAAGFLGRWFQVWDNAIIPHTPQVGGWFRLGTVPLTAPHRLCTLLRQFDLTYGNPLTLTTLDVTPDGYLEVNSNPSLRSSIAYTDLSQWHWFEWRCAVNSRSLDPIWHGYGGFGGEDGQVWFRLDKQDGGTQQGPTILEPHDPSDLAAPFCDTVRLGGNSADELSVTTPWGGGTLWLDDLYAAGTDVDDDRFPTTFIGPVRVQPVVPIGDGRLLWSFADSWQRVNEVPPDGDATTLSAPGSPATFRFPAVPLDQQLPMLAQVTATLKGDYHTGDPTLTLPRLIQGTTEVPSGDPAGAPYSGVPFFTFTTAVPGGVPAGGYQSFVSTSPHLIGTAPGGVMPPAFSALTHAQFNDLQWGAYFVGGSVQLTQYCVEWLIPAPPAGRRSQVWLLD
jgi:hypothetical protein